MNEAAAKIRETLTAQRDVTEAFQALLHRERDAITKSDAELLQKITEEKLAAIETLSKVEIDTLTALQDAGATEGGKEIEKLLTSLTSDKKQADELISLWNEVKQLAKTCHNENQINGQIIEAGMNQTEQTLDILLGRTQTKLYGASGKTLKNKGGTIAKA